MKVGCRRWSATIFERALLARARRPCAATKLPPFDALPCSAVEAGAADDQRAGA